MSDNHKPEYGPKFVTPVGRILSCNILTDDETIFDNPRKEFKGVEQETHTVDILLDKSEGENKLFFDSIVKQQDKIALKAFKKKIPLLHPPIIDGDDTDKDYLQGNYRFRAKFRCAVGKDVCKSIIFQDQMGQRIMDPLALDCFRDGNWARVQAQLKSYHFGGSKGVTSSLLTIQFARQDDPLFNVKGDEFDAVESYDAETDEGVNDLLGEQVD